MRRMLLATQNIVGQRIARADAREKVTGSAQYVGDLPFARLAVARMLRSPYAHARITAIDTAAAEALPGVLAVLTHCNAPAVAYTNNKWDATAVGTRPRQDQVLLSDHVRYAGEPVAVVAAVSAEIAAQACDLIEVSYEPLPVVTDPEQALAPTAPLLHPQYGSNLIARVESSRGDVAAGFAEADLVVERRFRTSRQKQCQMEPYVCVADVSRDGRLTVWAPTQTPHPMRAKLAEMFGLPASKVRVIVPHFGGGFGGRGGLLGEPYAVALALQLRRPVRLEFDRGEDFVGTETRHPMTIYVRAGVKRDGTLTAWEARTYTDAGGYATVSIPVTTAHGNGFMRLYRCPNVSFEGHVCYTNNPVAGAFRGYGGAQMNFAQEQVLDEVAARLGLDPLTYRDRIRRQAGEIDPRTNLPHASFGLTDCIRQGSERIGWAERAHQPPLPAPWRRGHGMAMAMWNSGTGCTGPATLEGCGATVRVNLDGSVDVRCGATDIGTGLTTTLSQIVSEALGIPMERIDMVLADTELTPIDAGAHASRSLFNAGNAIRAAALDAREQLLAAASRELEAAPEDLELVDGAVQVRGAAGRSLPLSLLCRKIYKEQAEILGTGNAPQSNAFGYTAHFAEVAVNTETGQLRVLRYVVAQDVGRAINPTVVEGQIEGSVAQGLGYALCEDLQVDAETGSVLNASFMDYKLMVASDMPPIEVIVVECPDPNGPFGAKGIGEISLPPVAPAIANAIWDAVGVRMSELPMTPPKVLAALARKEA